MSHSYSNAKTGNLYRKNTWLLPTAFKKVVGSYPYGTSGVVLIDFELQRTEKWLSALCATFRESLLKVIQINVNKDDIVRGKVEIA